MKSILIVGGGWLGLPLGEDLSALGFSVTVTKTTQAGVESLPTSLNGLQLCLPNASCHVNLSSFDVIVVCIPPGLKKEPTGTRYIEKLKALYQRLLSQKTHLIFCNSTGIYEGIEGDCDEMTTLPCGSQKSSILYEAEQLTQAQNFLRLTILRLGGLVGADRVPGRFLAGKRALKGAAHPVNLVHQYDVIQAIIHCIQTELSGTFNLVSPLRCTRKLFYTKSAMLLQLEPPEFMMADTSLGRRVSGDRITMTGFNYTCCTFEQLMDFQQQ
ncbi:Rossmann-fold NAD(P)-binding domain-containing protein [Algicola sagamiensis]|uniref:hypothetical protein n=1 Tax=Algicola sagamiensis TaxID=163869 RepID=UPI00036766D7|nr:hypothetical protein [Algicola sagamiensis]